MPHLRKRHASPFISKLASLWPAVGVVGMRQTGKSTLLMPPAHGARSQVTLDDADALDAALHSPKNFLARFDEPLVIDEIQKAPKLFDALKLSIDRRKRPGRFLVTGSIDFSRRVGVRESLTGRMGVVQLFPLCLSEMFGTEYQPERVRLHQRHALRHVPAEVAAYLGRGGMPVPSFIRDDAQRATYFQGWLETTIFRDAARAYGRNYDPEFCFRLIQEIAHVMEAGELPTLSTLRGHARKLRPYLTALCDVFLLQRIPCHPAGTGRDAYLIADSGIAAHLFRSRALTSEATHSLLRIFLLNELLCLHRYQGLLALPTYYKSARSSPVDFVFQENGTDDLPIAIVPGSQATGWDLRPLQGMLKKLRLPRGMVCTGSEQVDLEPKGISQVPWSYWS